jgi:hypothetical protein
MEYMEHIDHICAPKVIRTAVFTNFNRPYQTQNNLFPKENDTLTLTSSIFVGKRDSKSRISEIR